MLEPIFEVELNGRAVVDIQKIKLRNIVIQRRHFLNKRKALHYRRSSDCAFLNAALHLGNHVAQTALDRQGVLRRVTHNDGVEPEIDLGRLRGCLTENLFCANPAERDLAVLLRLELLQRRSLGLHDQPHRVSPHEGRRQNLVEPHALGPLVPRVGQRRRWRRRHDRSQATMSACHSILERLVVLGKLYEQIGINAHLVQRSHCGDHGRICLVPPIGSQATDEVVNHAGQSFLFRIGATLDPIREPFSTSFDALENAPAVPAFAESARQHAGGPCVRAVAVPAHLALNRTLGRFVSGLVAIQTQLPLQVRVAHRCARQAQRTTGFRRRAFGRRVDVVVRLVVSHVAPLIHVRRQDHTWSLTHVLGHMETENGLPKPQRRDSRFER